MSAANVVPFEDPKPSTSIVLVTPETAARWLALNKINRTVREKVVDIYARDMAEGRWELTGSPIQFDKSGNLIDGQHRLYACIKAQLPVMFVVVRGLASSAQLVIDSGAKRTSADSLGFLGYSNGHLLAASVRLAILVEDGRIWGDTQLQGVSTGEITAWLDEHPDFERIVSIVASFRQSIEAPPSVLVVAYWLLDKVDPKDAARFFHGLATLEGLTAGSPITAVVSRLREIRKQRTSMSGGVRRDLIGMLIRAWNAWRAGNTMRSIPLTSRTTGKFPRPL